MTDEMSLRERARANRAAIDQRSGVRAVHPIIARRVGGDLAFDKDASAATFGQARGPLIEVLEIIERKPSVGKPLVPSEIMGEIVTRAVHYECESICADVHYRATAKEYTTPAGLAWIDAPADVVEPYRVLRTFLRERRIKFRCTHKNLRRQLIETEMLHTDGGHSKIIHPRREGSHGDIVSALVLLVWSLRNDVRGAIGQPIGAPHRSFGDAVEHAIDDDTEDDDEDRALVTRGGLGGRWRRLGK